MASDDISLERFKLMERKLFFGIMTPGAVLTLAFGTWLWLGAGYEGVWLPLKLVLVALLVLYHLWCGKLLLDFRHGRNTRSHRWYRWFNEAPIVLLLAIVYLAVFKPVSF